MVCQAMSEATLPPGLMICYCFRIACCAADARSIFIFVKKNEEFCPDNDAWVQAREQLSLYEHRGNAIPLITAKTIVSEKEPAVPFLF